MFNHILEISSKTNHGGRVPIKIALLKIHDVETETNANGIHWNEEYIKNTMDSAKMMPICAEFADETKEIPIGHGMTGIMIDENGVTEPVFLNSETVGVIEYTEISMINIDGTDVKVLLGCGYLYNQRYPNFVKWIRTNLVLGTVLTSVEIMGLAENDNKISYLEDKPTEKYRTPMGYSFSGTAIMSIPPSDTNAIVVEIAQKQNKEEQTNMTEKEIMDAVQKAISETNSIKETTIAEKDAKINELNSLVVVKDDQIIELNASVEQLQTALSDLKKQYDTYWAERDLLEKELAKAKVTARIGELNGVISSFTEEEQKFAEVEINELKAKLEKVEKIEDLENVTSEINSIKSKICTSIVENQKKSEAEERVAEQNSKKKSDTIDIFSEINSDDTVDNDTNIF